MLTGIHFPTVKALLTDRYQVLFYYLYPLTIGQRSKDEYYNRRRRPTRSLTVAEGENKG